MKIETFEKAKEIIERLEHFEDKKGQLLNLSSNFSACFKDAETGEYSYIIMPFEIEKTLLEKAQQELSKKIEELGKKLADL